MEDAMIIDLYWARDEAAIRETDSKYGRYLSRIAENVLDDAMDSEEAVNDTYLHAWNTIPPSRPDRLRLFLGKITRELAIDSYRRKTAKKRLGSQYTLSLDELAECLASPDSPDEEVDRKELGAAITAWLATQTSETRAMFIRRYFYLDPLAKIAGELAVSEPKVKSALFRARQSLKKYLHEEGYVL